MKDEEGTIKYPRDITKIKKLIKEYTSFLATDLLRILDPHKIIYTSGEHVASEFERLCEVVRDIDVALLAAVMSYWKWAQIQKGTGDWYEGKGVGTCPLCLFNGMLRGCETCSLGIVTATNCYKKDSPYVLGGQVLLAALKKAIAYEIERYPDYDPEALRRALAGTEKECPECNGKGWIKEFDPCEMGGASESCDECKGTGIKLRPGALAGEQKLPEVIIHEGENIICPECGRNAGAINNITAYLKFMSFQCLDCKKRFSAKYLKKIQAEQEPPEVIEIVMDEDGPSQIGYNCKKCGVNMTIFRDASREWTHYSCRQPYKLRIRAKEKQPPEVIAEEDEDGRYLYLCPHCKTPREAHCTGENTPPCANTHKKYIVHRRSRYERWAEENTELWCVYYRAEEWEIYPAKIARPFVSAIVVGRQKDEERERHNYLALFVGNPYSNLGYVYSAKLELAIKDPAIAYLGESHEDALKAALEKWVENHTKLFLVRSSQTSPELIVRKITVSDNGRYYELGCYLGMIKDLDDERDYITPNFDRAVTWLKKELIDEEQ